MAALPNSTHSLIIASGQTISLSNAAAARFIFRNTGVPLTLVPAKPIRRRWNGSSWVKV